MNNYKQTPFNLNSIVAQGNGKICYMVDGYREKDAVTIEIERKRDYYSEPGTEPKWTIDVACARWLERESDSKLSPLDATQNLIQAMSSALAQARKIESNKHTFEAQFQVAEAERKRIAEEEAAEAKVKADADKPVGMKLAKQIVEHMKSQARNTEKGRYAGHNNDHEMTLTLADRGTRQERQITIHRSWAGLMLFSHGSYGARIAKNDAMALIANSAIDALKVDKINFVDPKLVKFMMKM